MIKNIRNPALAGTPSLPALFSLAVSLGACLCAPMALADASLVSVVVCDARNVCERVMVDKAAANLYKISPMGSIVINSSVADNEDEAKSAMRECNALKRKIESSASEPETNYTCRLEPAGDNTH